MAFCFYLADIERIEEDSVQEILEAEKHHLYEGDRKLSVCMASLTPP